MVLVSPDSLKTRLSANVATKFTLTTTYPSRSLLAWLCQTWKMLYFTTMKTKNSLAKYHLQFPLYKIYGTNMQLPSIRIRFLVQMTLCVLYTCNGMYALWPNPFLSTCILSDGNVYCMHPLGDIELLNRNLCSQFN